MVKTRDAEANFGKNRSQDVSGCLGEHLHDFILRSSRIRCFSSKIAPKTLEKLQILGQVLASLPLVLSAVAGLAALVGCRGQRFKGLKSGSFNGLV